MEKQPNLPLKFYPVNGWQDYEDIKNYSQDISIVNEHFMLLPGFSLLVPNEGFRWNFTLLTTFEIIDYETSVQVIDVTTNWQMIPEEWTVSNKYRVLQFRRQPPANDVIDIDTPRLVCYHIADESGDNHWYSEPWNWCDIGLDARPCNGGDGWTADVGFAEFASSCYIDNPQAIDMDFCKTSAVAAAATKTGDMDAFLEEEIEIFIRTGDTSAYGACAPANWNASVFLEFQDSYGTRVSPIMEIATNNTLYHFKIKLKSANATLWAWMAVADTSKGFMRMWMFRTWSPSKTSIRWRNSRNLCKIFYEDTIWDCNNFPELTGPDNLEHVIFLNAKPVPSDNELAEEVSEDDETNKYRLIGTNKKYKALQFAGGESLLNAMSLLRLHDTVTIYDNKGEKFDVADMFVEHSPVDYMASLIKINFREDSCSGINCDSGFCCPTMYIPTIWGFSTAIGAAEACGGATNGKYWMSDSGGRAHRLYYCNGAAWALNATYDIADYCVEVRDCEIDLFAYNKICDYSSNYFWFNATHWSPFLQISSVVDATGGVATINLYTDYYTGQQIVGQYLDCEQGKWIDCTDVETLTSGAVAMSCQSGAGTYMFRVNGWIGECEWYSQPVSQTIT